MIVPRECTTRRMVTFTATIIITFITSKPDFAIRSISNPSDKNEFWISKNEASSDLFKSQSITKSGWWVESFNYRTLPVIKWPLFKSVAYWPRFCMICLSKYSALLCQYYIIHHFHHMKSSYLTNLKGFWIPRGPEGWCRFHHAGRNDFHRTIRWCTIAFSTPKIYFWSQ